MSLLDLTADSRDKDPGSALQGTHSFGAYLIAIPGSESPPWQHMPFDSLFRLFIQGMWLQCCAQHAIIVSSLQERILLLLP